MIGLAPEIPEDLYMLIKKVMPTILPFSIAFPMDPPINDDLSLTSFRRSLYASTSSVTARTRTPNSALFSSNPESTVCHDTTRLSACCLQRGDTRVRPLAHWWHKLVKVAKGKLGLEVQERHVKH